jgi:Tol biopolymer transport system component
MVGPAAATVALVGIAAVVLAVSQAGGPGPLQGLHDTRELHLSNVRQITTLGGYAEAYWSPDGKRIICQARRGDMAADRMFVLNTDGTGERQASNGQGRCTCGYFLPGGRDIIYSSTHGHAPEPPPSPDRSKGYVWPVWNRYAIYRARADGSGARAILPRKVEPGKATAYYAEATVAPNGKRIVFTSNMDGDLDIYSMRVDGADIRRITNRYGYDGGPFYSPDGSMIVWRAGYPRNAEEKAEYAELLKQELVRPSKMEIWAARADGSNPRQVTRLGGAAFAPSFTPDGQSVIFSSNHHDPTGRSFELFVVRLDGSGLERITYGAEFDCFPMFSPDGRRLMWCSNRNGPSRHTDIFIADWKP